MALTDLQVKQARPRERDWKISDGGGLYLLIRPNGSKLWRMKHRRYGKEKKLSFGSYPAVGLREARLLRDEARVEIGREGAPARRKREERLHSAAASCSRVRGASAGSRTRSCGRNWARGEPTPLQYLLL